MTVASTLSKSPRSMGGHILSREGEQGHVCHQAQEVEGDGDLLGICWAFSTLTESAGQRVASHALLKWRSAPQRTRLPQGQGHHLY